MAHKKVLKACLSEQEKVLFEQIKKYLCIKSDAEAVRVAIATTYHTLVKGESP